MTKSKQYLKERKLIPYKRLWPIAVTTTKYVLVMVAGWFFISLYLLVTNYR